MVLQNIPSKQNSSLTHIGELNKVDLPSKYSADDIVKTNNFRDGDIVQLHPPKSTDVLLQSQSVTKPASLDAPCKTTKTNFKVNIASLPPVLDNLEKTSNMSKTNAIQRLTATISNLVKSENESMASSTAKKYERRENKQIVKDPKSLLIPPDKNVETTSENTASNLSSKSYVCLFYFQIVFPYTVIFSFAPIRRNHKSFPEIDPKVLNILKSSTQNQK